MAVAHAIRWRPTPFRSTIEAITVPAATDAEGNPTGPGGRVQTLQLIVFDSDKFGSGNTYQPGDPATEQHLAIVEEVQITLDIAAFAGKTIAQSQAMWDAARDEQITAWQADPHIQAKINAAIGGALSSYVVL